MYILYGSRSRSARCAPRAHDRAVQPPAQPRLVACLGLIARLQLLLQLPHQHVHQVFLDSLHRARLEEVGAEARLAECLWATRCDGGRAQREDARMVKNWDVLEFYFLEW